MIAWEEDGAEDAWESLAGGEEEAPPQANPTPPTASSEEADHDASPPPQQKTQLLPAGDTTPPPAAAPPEPSSPPTPRGPLTPSEHEKLNKLWGATVQPAHQGGMTIRGTHAAGGSDTKLVIQTRALRGLQDHAADVPLQQRADYELLEVIGEGGMGVVYAARQASIDRTVAIKMLHPEITDDQQQRAKFLSEAVVTGELEHPNIVPIYDLGSNHEGALFYCMKRVKGTPWSESVRNKSPRDNIDILMKVADAIAFAHSRGVVHRDIKPENVMLGDFGEVMVLDWGIALPLESKRAGVISGASGMGGTPAYMAPEMATGPMKKIGVRSDVYLLGAVLFEIITGKAPHPGDDAMACIRSAAANVIRPATEHQGKLLDIALKAMSANPGHRYANVLEFQQAIREYLAHSESIQVASRAQEHLTRAKAGDGYQDFQRAQFGFQQALEMWPGNTLAEAGLERARLAYATRALKKEDFDLGLSLLDESRPAHASLLHSLRSGRIERENRQRRIRTMRAMAAAMVVIILGGTAWYSYTLNNLNRMLSDLNDSKEKANDELKAKNLEIDEANGELNRTNATLTTTLNELNTARNEANREAQRAREGQQRVLRSAYRLAIGLVPQRLEDNSFTQAEEILERVPPRMRHFEWGRLAFLTQAGVNLAMQAPTDPPSSAARRPILHVALSESGGLAAASAADGRAWIWRTDRGLDPWLQLHHGELLKAAAISPDGAWAATVGGDAQRGMVKLWNLAAQEGESYAELRTPAETYQDAPHPAAVLSVRFWRDSQTLLTTSADQTACLWERAADAKPRVVSVFRGHLDQVRSADASRDRRWLATASDDGTVRLWRVNLQRQANGEPGQSPEVERFRGHQGPVLSVALNQATADDDELQVASAGNDQQVLVWRTRVQAVSRLAAQFQTTLGEVFEQMLAAELRRRVGGPRTVAVLAANESSPSGLRTAADALARRPTQALALRGHQGVVTSVCFSEDGGRIASAAKDNAIKIWSPASGAEKDAGAADRATSEAVEIRVAEAEANVATLLGHGSTVQSIALLPQAASPAGEPPAGLGVVSGSFDGRVKLWRVGSRQDMEVLSPEDPAAGPAACAAISEDSRWIVVGHEDGAARLFDAATGERLAVLSEGHEFLAAGAAYFDQGRKLLTIAGDDTIRIWDVQTGTELRRLADTGYRAVAALSPSEQLLATGSNQHSLKIWSTESWEPVAELLLDEAEQQLEMLRRTYRPAADESEKAFEARLAEMLPDVSAAAFSFDDRYVAIGDSSGLCRVAEVASGRVVASGRAHNLTITAARFVQVPGEGPLLLTASFDGTVIGWRFDSVQEQLTPVERLRHPGPITAFAAKEEEDGVTVFTACPQSSDNAADRDAVVEIRAWRWGEAEPRRQAALTADQVSGLDVRRDNEAWDVLLTTAYQSRSRLLRWRVSLDAEGSGEPPRNAFPNDINRGLISSAVFTPNGAEVLAIGGKGARTWDLDTGDKTLSFRQHGALTAVGFLPPGFRIERASPEAPPMVVWRPEAAQDAALIFTAGHDQSVKIWSYQPGQPPPREASARWRLEGGLVDQPLRRGHQARIQSAVVHRDGDHLLLLTASADRTARVWKQSAAGPWEVIRIYGGRDGHQGAIQKALFSPEGRRILTVSDDRRALIWEFSGPDAPRPDRLPEESQPLHVLAAAEGGALKSAAFTSDGKWVATAGDDLIIRLWSLAPELPDDQRLAASLSGHSEPVQGLAFSRDRQRLVSAAGDGYCKIWDTHALLNPNLVAAETSRETAFSELLDLQTPGPDLHSAVMAADGSGVLTAGEEGLAYFLRSLPVAPSLQVSAGAMRLETSDLGQFEVDPHLSVFEPTRWDYAGWTLHVSLHSPDADLELSGESLVLEAPADGEPNPGRLTRQGENLLYRAADDQPWRTVAVLNGDQSRELRLELNSETSAMSLEALAKSVRYRPALQSQDGLRSVRFALAPPEGEQPAPESSESSGDEKVIVLLRTARP